MKLFISFFFLLLCSLQTSCQATLVKKNKPKEIVWNQHVNKVYKEGIKFGIKIYDKPYIINYRNNNVKQAVITVDEPTLVYRAKKEYGWGFVQFPRLFEVGNKFAVKWNMHKDDITAKPKHIWKYSKDKGKSWNFNHKNRPYDKGVLLTDSSSLKLFSKKYDKNKLLTKGFKLDKKNAYTKEISSENIKEFNDVVFYDYKKLNDSLLAFNSVTTTKKGKVIKNQSPVKYLKNTVKHSYKGIYSNQLWGKMTRLQNGDLLTCQYPYFSKDEYGKINMSGVAFFKSTDNGGSWNQISQIPFFIDKELDKDNKKYRTFIGYSEPTFQVLDDKKVICILRSSPTYKEAPMYMSVSNDLGGSWSKPKAITNNGVLPQLLLLDNGVLVLSYGRPGVQVRFLNTNDTSLEWSDPIELLRVKGLRGQVSCGYTSMLPLSEDKFLIVYSDFRSRDDQGIPRKAILSREISIQVKK